MEPSQLHARPRNEVATLTAGRGPGHLLSLPLEDPQLSEHCGAGAQQEAGCPAGGGVAEPARGAGGGAATRGALLAATSMEEKGPQDPAGF